MTIGPTVPGRAVRGVLLALIALTATFCWTTGGAPAGEGDKDKKDPYAEYVWPAPPDPPRVRLVDILRGRADLEASSRLQKTLFGASANDPYDWMKKPFAVEFDVEGRILVTDPGLGVLYRFDRKGRKVDVFGTTGTVRLKTPLGLAVAPDGTIYVADVGIKKVVAYDGEGHVKAVFGKQGELENPTDAAVSPGGQKLFVADSKAHRVSIFDLKTGHLLASFGKRGVGNGEFNFPSALAFDRDGNLFVVDQINARVQVLTQEGEFLEQLGGLGVGFGNFVRPKDVAVDGAGLVYVTDAAFNNVQIFSPELKLLTFVGAGGSGPGGFQVASGVACHGDEFVVVDQLGARVQLFRFVAGREAK